MNESFELHDTLNQKLWTEENTLIPEVGDALRKIISEFLSNSEVLSEKDVIDVELVGSNASYNYTNESDLDLHLVVNMEDLSCDPELVQIACNAEKSSFNKNYDLSVKGIEVELYVEDVKASTASNGIYSLFKEKWIKFPEPIESVDYSTDTEFISKLDELVVEVNQVLSSASSSFEIQDEINNLYNTRRESIMSEGEYGFGNQLFKEIRSLGLLDDLKDKKFELASKELSLESLKESNDKVITIYRGIDPTLEQFDKGVSWWTTSYEDAYNYGPGSSDDPDKASVMESVLNLDSNKGLEVEGNTIVSIYQELYNRYIENSERVDSGSINSNLNTNDEKDKENYNKSKVKTNDLNYLQPTVNNKLKNLGYKYLFTHFNIGNKQVDEIAIFDDSILDYSSPDWYLRENKQMKRYRINYMLKEDYHYSYVEGNSPEEAAKLVYNYFNNSDDYELLNIEEPEEVKGPDFGPDSGLSSAIIAAINDEWQTISTYNDLANTARAENREDIAKVIDDINAEENKHVGQLQEVMKTLSSVTKEISSGEVEGMEQLTDNTASQLTQA